MYNGHWTVRMYNYRGTERAEANRKTIRTYTL